MQKLVFLDTETTSLRPDRRAWEVGYIVRDENGDQERCYQIRIADLDLGNADPKSLAIGGFYDRHYGVAYSSNYADRELDVLVRVEGDTRGALIVGAVPDFDAEVLATRMRANGICPAWHYHLVDVETLAAGALKLPPKWDFDTVLAAYGLTYDEADRHTALGDARMVRDLYDAVMAGPR